MTVIFYEQLERGRRGVPAHKVICPRPLASHRMGAPVRERASYKEFYPPTPKRLDGRSQRLGGRRGRGHQGN